MKRKLHPYTKTCLPIAMTVLMIICMACSNSPIEDQNEETPDLENILKDMVLIPAGEFLMGSPDGEGLSNEHPQHQVYLDAYYIDRYEVTNAQFKEFIDATGYVTETEQRGGGWVLYRKYGVGRRRITWAGGANWSHPKGVIDNMQDIKEKMDHPVVQVSWNDAVAYAQWAGKRLPTEADWEKVARGTDGRQWPWGNLFNLDIGGITIHANINNEDTVPVGQFPTDASPYGVCNMAGNVREWVADWYASDYYEQSPHAKPTGPKDGNFRVLRGGSWANSDNRNMRCAVRVPQAPDYSSHFIGFRCVLDFASSNGE